MSSTETSLMVNVLLPAARLSGNGSDRAFRVILDTTTRPGTIARIADPEVLEIPPALWPVLALANVDTRVAVLGARAEEPWLDLVCQATDARPTGAGVADIITVLRDMDPSVVADARPGTSSHPEQGARIIIACEKLRFGDSAKLEASVHASGKADGLIGCTLRLLGPGIETAHHLAVTGIAASVFEQLALVNAVHPCGVDVHLVDQQGYTASLPRSTQIEVLTALRSESARP